MIKALIITYYWPPSGGSGVQRWLKFVKCLRDFDIEPIIYTVENPDYVFNDDSLLSDIPDSIEILKQPIWEPYQIVNLFSKQKVESAGFLGQNNSILGKIKNYIRANYFIPDARMFWINPSVKFLKKYLKENKVDLIISTGPPHSLHLIGLKLKEQLGVKWIADFRDPWTEIDYFHHLPLTEKSRKKHHQLEQNVLKNADEIIVVGNSMKENYSKFSNNITVITNGYDTENSNEKVPLDQKFSITHIGLMNADRNHPFFWKVLSEFSADNESFKNDLEIKLIGKVDETVLKSIQDLGLQSNLNLIPYIPHDEVINCQLTSQILLLSINNVPAAKGIITGKVFEYLQSKRPILAIAPLDGDLAAILKETNAGEVINFDDETTLRMALETFYKSYQQNDLQVKSSHYQEYHRKNLTRQLSVLIKKCVRQ
ncbi:MAG: glycosyltransferase family 4 protein [Flavobacteriaceae bacterium]|nr:glycosyltransferase family 4 protein [Flavobacteriaceae bacterium]